MFVFTSIFMQDCCRSIEGKEYTFRIVAFNFSKVWKISNYKIEYLNTNAIVMQNNDTIWLNLLDSHIQIAYFNPVHKSGLFACSPSNEDYFNFINNWDSMNIRTLDDFDNSHRAGSSINDVCILSPTIEYNTRGMLYDPTSFSKMTKDVQFNNEFSIGLLSKPTNNAVRIQFCFYNTKTNDSTVSVSPILRFQ